MSIIGTPLALSLQSHYASLADLYAVAGQTNIDTYSDLDGNGARDDSRVQSALNWADAEIDRRCRQAGLSTPIARDHAAFGHLTEAAARIAVTWLYNARGTRDTEPGANKGAAWAAQANQILNRLLIPGRMDSAERMESTVPTGVVL